MTIRRVCAFAFAALGLAACAPAAPPPRVAQPAFYVSLASGAAVDAESARQMISLYRGNHGLGALRLDPRLQEAAQAQADAMAQRATADATGFKQRVAAVGGDPSRSAENVSAGYHTLAEAFSGWRDSKPHNAVMLKRDAARMGIATASAPSTKYKVYWALVVAP